MAIGAGAHRQHGERRDLVDLAGDGAEVALGDRWSTGGAAGVRGLQPVDVERHLGGDERVEEPAGEDGVVAHVDDVVGVVVEPRVGAGSSRRPSRVANAARR